MTPINLKAVPVLLVLLLCLSIGTSQEREDNSTQESDLLVVSYWKFSGDSRVTESLPEFHDVVQYVQSRVGVSVDVIPGSVSVFFEPMDTNSCRNRGIAMMLPRDPSISIFVDEQTSRDQILGILAHELGHVFQFFGVQGRRSVEGLINEGFATWVAGRYWLEWQGTLSFQDAVRSYLDSGTYLPLLDIQIDATDSSSEEPEDCLARRDLIYTEWAAFIEYLREEYGQSKLDSLFRFTTGESAPSDTLPTRRLPDYGAVYGKTLDQLESEWLEELRTS